MDTTFDGILNRQVTLEQPKSGFRVAIDTVFLAAAVPAKPKETVLELGCGVGGAMLALAFRCRESLIHGIDLQSDMVNLCKKNIVLNGFVDRLTADCRNVVDLLRDQGRSYDHVMINPPYHNEEHHDVSKNLQKRLSHSLASHDIDVWFEVAAGSMKQQGTLSLIHKTDQLDFIRPLLEKYFGKIMCLPLIANDGGRAKRSILRAQTSPHKEFITCHPLILHKPDGRYTEEADNILRQAQPLYFNTATENNGQSAGTLL